MIKSFVAAVALSSAFASSTAFADDLDPASAPAPVQPTAPVPPPAPIATPACSLGAHAGIPDADASTAAQIVCDEIFKLGATPGVRYRVGLGKLGNVLILSVTVESAPGTIQDHKQLQLSGIEEVSVAAPRIAESVVHGTPLTQTQKVDNIVGDEARKPRKKSGSTHFALGLIGVMPPLSSGGSPAPGIDLEFSYESGSFALAAGLRAATTGGQDNTHVGYVALAIGGRYFLTDTDIAPYIGGGLAWTGLSVRTNGNTYDNGGLGAYTEIGVQALRTHRTHLTLGLRADLPFYSLKGSSVYDTATASYSSAVPSLYYVPLTIGLGITF
jgi:hypothetical protein